ncbi:MAG TPA: FtsK/SpoIIIE domain-containing protein, partial [Actinomycetes bacterium]|nr:FtsK/SpoIIIE domain-containing protein [Actinomycetes bacterium]
PRTIEAPPTLPEGRSGNPLQALLPVAGATSSLGMMLVFRNPAMLAVGALIMVVTIFGGLAMLLSQSGQAARQRRQQRERYLDYLEELRQELAADEQRARAEALALDPPPAALVDVVRDPARRWERRRADEDFLRLRAGMGQVPARPVALQDDGTSLRPTDRFMRAEARAVVRRFASVPQMPLAVPLDRAGNVSLVGERAAVLELARALLVQLAALHAPDDVALAVAASADRLDDWSWTKWLPHLLDSERRDGPTEARRIAPGLDQLAGVLAADLGARATYAAEARRGLDAGGALALAPRLLVVHDAGGDVAKELPLPDQAVSAPDMGVTVLHLVGDRLHEPEEVAVRVTVDGRRVTVEDLRPAEAAPVTGLLDEVPPPMAEGLARMLAPLRLSPESVVEDNPHAGPVHLPAMLGVDDPTALDLERLWAPRSERDFLRVPIGVTDAGEPLRLDLKEPAQLGMGPHGLCVGATGSGKSELLRTLVLALAVTHPPDRLGMVLIDYKGGATFAPFAGLPHVAGVITNLADDAGEPLLLDLKQPAQLGMGPHGLCVGATGSGKSELLRTLVLALAATHPPERLGMVLIDYKGGATFAPFAGLPQVAGVITNLADDAGLVERVHASLAGEVQRRQQVLKDAGNLAHVADYAAAREADPGLEPLPHLLVIIDEFGELLTAKPEFVELFLTIGRIGRSIGVHLLLSSQRIESGKLRGLETYLSYRIGLRTFSEEESRTVLDSPDAFHLPALPGFGYLKVDTSVYQRFKSGYVSGPYRGPVQAVAKGEERLPVRPYTAYNLSDPSDAARRADAEAARETSGLPERSAGPRLLDVLVGGLVRHGRRIQNIWLPPLPSLVALDEVTGPVRIGDDGMRLPVRAEPLQVPIGLLDDARRQWQGVWNLDLASAGGHVALIGGPQTGKTTLLRTLVLSLALTHTPAQAAVYGLDLLGGGLQVLAGLPNVGGIAGRS